MLGLLGTIFGIAADFISGIFTAIVNFFAFALFLLVDLWLMLLSWIAGLFGIF